MEPAEAAKVPEGRKRFTIQSAEDGVAMVKPLFKPSSAAKSSPAPEVSALPRAASYAEYVVGKAAASLAPKAAPAASVAKEEAASETLPPDGKTVVGQAAAPSVPKATAETSGEGPASETLLPSANTSNAPGTQITAAGDSLLSPAAKPGAKSNSIIVSPRQRGNPILKFVRNVPWEFGEIVPDYVLGQSTCALFLSLRYYNLNPNYIHERLQRLGRMYALQVLLVQVDVKDPHQALKELAKICILADCTLILAWSPEEAGRYLETYKAYEQKPADLLKEKVDQDFLSRVTDCLTSVKSVNKTDTLSLLSAFGAKRLFDALHEPFLKDAK
uniref:ERCC excision repair 1, endonuclease non-catalytic subunit n=1 Tax=Sphenodon punctatus TaxID=8508 RepID=A0A8D0H063_SPHPU